jgi:nucleoid-associated protein YgaU
MVPLTLDLCNDRPASPRSRPLLVLKDLTEDAAPPVRRPCRSPFARVENTLLAAAAVSACGYFLWSAAASLTHSIQQNYAVSALPQTVVIAKTVKRGDTLAGLALRYGDPNIYLLQREDQIARANHLAGAAPLLPGQHLRIPVTNPKIIAQIVRISHHALLASRG